MQLEELEDAVMIYDSKVKTGNDILDTILTEKSLLCESRKTQLACVADGGALSFLDAVDLYTILGNALDNAIESVSRLSDPQQRTISLLIASKGDAVMIQTENPFDGNLVFDGDLPSSTKAQEPGFQGFGLKSIRYTAEKYHGFLRVEAEDGLFLLRVILQGERKA